MSKPDQHQPNHLPQPDELLVTKSQYSADPLLFALERKISELAMKWRGTKDAKVVEQYQATLKCLIALGWETDLDADAELPDRLMPKEYFEHIERLYKNVEATPIPK
jgi:hypothetical protein